jgi:hypothetical protein
MPTSFRSVISRVLRLGKRSVLITLLAVSVTTMMAPSQVLAAKHVPHFVHPTDDGVEDPPLVP